VKRVRRSWSEAESEDGLACELRLGKLFFPGDDLSRCPSWSGMVAKPFLAGQSVFASLRSSYARTRFHPSVSACSATRSRRAKRGGPAGTRTLHQTVMSAVSYRKIPAESAFPDQDHPRLCGFVHGVSWRKLAAWKTAAKPPTGLDRTSAFRPSSHYRGKTEPGEGKSFR